MATDQIIVINQLASRLENATSVERVYALQELQSHARAAPEIVGSLSLRKILDFLQEQGSAEEYQEALDVIYRLVKCKDQRASAANAGIILGDVNAVELLLDLLNHEDLTVGVMTSQILTEIHACNGAALEQQIQQIPDGMNKLLQRLPDSSREEVRNQAIVLIQQLTSSNEEMKKTVVFNEGFEILFGIIQREGGFEDAGLVVQDCLHICNNILSDSETCQRLFYAMGTDWILRLADFFDPALLESLEKSQFSAALDGSDSDEDNNRAQSGGWYEDPARLACAALSLSALYNSLSTPNKKHQNLLATTTAVVVSSAAFWLARRGPSELATAALSLLTRLVDGGNGEVGHLLANMFIKVTPAVPRKTIPPNVDVPTLNFGWKPLPNDDRRFISLLSLLVERYIYPAEAWDPPNGPVLGSTLRLRYQQESLPSSMLAVLESILSSDSSLSDLIVQYVLAPPPPPHIDGMFADEFAQAGLHPDARQLESMRPLGTHVLRLLVEGCSRVLEGAAGKTNLDTAERAANVMAVLFVHGSQLGRELSTAITTAHSGVVQLAGSATAAHKMLLPMLLFTAGRTARNAGSAGYPFLIALLRMLACVASGCEVAAKQMLDDPANLFVVDLATAASDSAGVPPLVQTAACLFLGCCFGALPAATATPPPSSNGTAPASEDSILNRKSFLGMIDGRIGLNRFTDILKKPLAKPTIAKKDSNNAAGASAGFFISADFEAFYRQQVDAIRAGIFEFYTGGVGDTPGDAMQQQLIAMQQERIAELEAMVAQLHGGGANGASAVTTATVTPAVAAAPTPGVSEAEAAALRAQIAELQSTLQDTSAALVAAQEAEQSGRVSHETERAHAQLELAAARSELHRVEADRTRAMTTIAALETDAAAAEIEREKLAAQLAQAQSALDRSKEEILALKSSAVREHQDGKVLRETLEQRDRKIALLEEELRGMKPNDGAAERKIGDLESRNAELKQQVWTMEAELEKLRSAAIAPPEPQSPARFSDVPLVDTPVPQALVQDTEDLDRVATRVVRLAGALGADQSLADFATTTQLLHSEQAPVSERLRAMLEVLDLCEDVLSSSVGECSDIAEGAGFRELDGAEGSLQRAVDCCRKLSEAIRDADDRAEEVRQLRLQLEMQEEQLADEERIRNELSDEVASLEAQLADARDVLTQAPPNQQAEVLALSEQLEALRADGARAQAEAATREAHLRSTQADLEQKLTASRHETETFKAELEALRHSNNQTEASVQVQLQDALRKLQEAEATVARLQQELKAAHEATSVKETAHREGIEKLKAELEALRHSNNQTEASVQVQLQDALRKLREAETTVARLQQDHTAALEAATANEHALREELTAVHAQEVQALKTACDTRVAELQSALLAAEEARATEAEETQMAQRVEVARVAADHQAIAAQWTVERVEMEARVAELEAQHASSHSALATATKELQAARGVARKIVREEQNALDGQRLLAGQFMVTAMNLRSELKAADKIIALLEEQLSVVRADAAELVRQQASHEGEVADQAQAVEVLQAQLDALHMQYDAEVASLGEAVDVQRALAAKATQELADLRAANEEEFFAQDTRYAELLVKNEAALAAAAEQSHQLQTLQTTLAAHQETERLLRAELASLQERLQSEQALVTQLRATYESSASSTDALQSQEQELRRLTQSVDNLSKDLQSKEQQVLTLTAKLRRQEGEHAGVLATFDSVKGDLEVLRAENERLTEQGMTLTKQLKDKERELRGVQTALEAERSQIELLRSSAGTTTSTTATVKPITSPSMADRKSAAQSDLLKKAELDLKELIASLVTTYRLTEYKVTSLTHADGSRSHTITAAGTADVLSDAPRLLEALRACVQSIIALRKTEFDERTKLLEKKDQELLSLRRILAAMESTDGQHTENVLMSPTTPLRHAPPAATVGAGAAAAGAGVSTQLFQGQDHMPSTPVQKAAASHGHSQAVVMMTPTTSTGAVSMGSSAAVRWSGAKSALQHVSPAAKQAAKLHSEVLKERAKLAALQEQHSDLLGLLAQQDVELSVFRDTIQNRLGPQELLTVEDQARRNAIDLYGSYTQFRYDL